MGVGSGFDRVAASVATRGTRGLLLASVFAPAVPSGAALGRAVGSSCPLGVCRQDNVQGAGSSPPRRCKKRTRRGPRLAGAAPKGCRPLWTPTLVGRHTASLGGSIPAFRVWSSPPRLARPFAVTFRQQAQASAQLLRIFTCCAASEPRAAICGLGARLDA